MQVGAVASVPLGNFGDVADAGYQGLLAGTVALGGSAALVRALGFYGRSPHAVPGNRSELYGLTVLGGYRLGRAYGLALTAWAGLGGAVHSRRSDTFPGLDASRRGLTVSGGATVTRSLGRVGVFVLALYMRGVGELDTGSYPTEWVAIGGGLEIPLGID